MQMGLNMSAGTSMPDRSPGEARLRPEQFIAKWLNSEFGERQGAQSFFNDICALVGHPDPATYGDPGVFTFEKWVSEPRFADGTRAGNSRKPAPLMSSYRRSSNFAI